MPDYKEMTFTELMKLAQSGASTAQFQVGVCYDRGYKGIPRDFLKAAEWYKKASALGNLAAKYNLGLMYYWGEGVERDREKAAEYMAAASFSPKFRTAALKYLFKIAGSREIYNYPDKVERVAAHIAVAAGAKPATSPAPL